MKASTLLVLGLAACAAATTPDQDYNLALYSRNASEALRYLDRAIAADPRAEYLTERARIHLALQQRSEALADYQAALERTPKDEPLVALSRARLLMKRALLFVAMGRALEADADLSEAIQLVPDFTEARLERARLRRKLGRRDDAERDVEAARRSGADQADYFYNEAVRALGINEEAVAERLIDFALDLDPGHSRAHVARARLSMARGRFEDAARELDQAVPVHPDDAELYYYRGTALLAVGRAEPAVKDFESASGLDPNEPRYLAARGLAKFRAGRPVEEARADFDAAIQKDDSCYPAWFNRGLVAYERKDYGDAEKDLRRAVSLHASPEGSIALARVLHERDSTDTALDLLRRAQQIYRAPDVQKALSEEIERLQRAKETKR
jgi:tetratricopeptide (TPR) repeat protein